MHSRASRGVTLIELLVVLVILAVAVSLAGPALIRASEKFGLKSAGRQIVSSIRATRSEARARQQELLAVLSGGQFIVDRGDGKQTPLVHLPKGVRVNPESSP